MSTGLGNSALLILTIITLSMSAVLRVVLCLASILSSSSPNPRSANLGLGIARRRSLRRRVVARTPPIQNIASSCLVPSNTFITFIYYKNYQKKALLFINKSISCFISIIVQSIYQKTKPRALTLLFYTMVNKGNYLI